MLISFGEALLIWRHRNGYNARKAGELLGVSHTTISNWEHGRRTPEMKFFMRFMRLADLDPMSSYAARWMKELGI